MRAAVFLVALPLTAHAEPRVFVEAGALVGKPTGTYSDASISPGYHLALGVTVAPNLSVLAGYRAMPLDEPQTPSTGLNAAPISYHHWDLSLGVRYAVPILPTLGIFGEASYAFAGLRESSTDFAGGDDVTETGSGFAARVGVLGRFDQWIAIGAAIGYSRASVPSASGPAFPSVSDAWLTIDAFVQAGW